MSFSTFDCTGLGSVGVAGVDGDGAGIGVDGAIDGTGSGDPLLVSMVLAMVLVLVSMVVEAFAVDVVLMIGIVAINDCTLGKKYASRVLQMYEHAQQVHYSCILLTMLGTLLCC